MAGPTRQRRSATTVIGLLLDRNVGGLTGDAARAVSTAHAFLIFSCLLTLTYVAFYMTYDLLGMRTLVIGNLVFAVIQVVGIALARLGRQFSASFLALATASLQILFVVDILGWQTGLHLYLVAGGQIVYLIFTEKQRFFRWFFVAVAAAVFLFAQLYLPASQASYPLPVGVMQAMLSFNAVLTLALMYVLAAFSYFRAEQARSEAAESAARAEYLANTDALTGLANRRPVMERLDQLSNAERGRFCVALAAIDSFKLLNDTWGHTCGDRVLAELGSRLRGQVRVTDSLGRWGGEEFIFILPGVVSRDAAIMIERVRSVVAGTPVYCAGHEHTVTISVGIAEARAGESADDAITRADNAMYEAKAAGRNNYVIAPRPAPAVQTAEVEKRKATSAKRVRRPQSGT
jgi:diguanylate cyclase (GGDEF)-like protein